MKFRERSFEWINACVIVIFIMTAIPFYTWGQLHDINATWSKQTNFGNRTGSLFMVIGKDRQGGVYLLRCRRNDNQERDIPYLLQHFDQKFRLTDSLYLKIKEGKNRYTTERVMCWKGKIYVLYLVSAKRKSATLYARELDPLTLHPSDISRPIWELEVNSNSGALIKDFRFGFSKDSSRIVFFREQTRSKDKNEKYEVAVFDSDLNLQWTKKIDLPDQQRKFLVQSCQLSNEGVVYWLGSNNGRYDVMTFSGKDTLARYPIRLGDTQLTNMQIELDQQNQLIVAGFYGLAGQQGALGIYYVNVNLAQQSINAKNMIPFSQKFILEDLNKKDAESVSDASDFGMPPVLNDYHLDRIIVLKDKSVLLIGEQRYRYDPSPSWTTPAARAVNGGFLYYGNRLYFSSSASSSATRQQPRYAFNDIIVVHIDQTGTEILWNLKIPKTQDAYFSQMNVSSYMCGNLDGRLWILFNDNPHNINQEKSWDHQRPKRYAGGRSALAMVSLTEEGEVIKQWIYNSVDVGVPIMPHSSFVDLTGEVIVYRRPGGWQQFGRIILR